MKKYFKWIVCVLSFIVFIILAYLVKENKDLYLDNAFYTFLSKYINFSLTNVVKYITYLGSALVVISITVLSLIFLKNKKYGLYMSIDLIVITLFQYLLKGMFIRVRPSDINLIDETGFSFPSGHSLTAMAFYGLIIYLIYKSSIEKGEKTLFILCLSFIILIIGLSRIYLGVHYTTDVLGAFSFSLSYIIIYTSIIGRRFNYEVSKV